MCYAIPGKVVKIEDSVVTVDYFGERRKAKNDFLKLNLGEYVLAQGGFIIQRISQPEAETTLEAWKELFFSLKNTDLKLSQRANTLHQRANYIRHKTLGNACCVHAIIEFSNYCRNDCLYCGIRKGNCSLTRYRMSCEEIINLASWAAKDLNFKALVLQSGEDTWFDDEKLVSVVERIMDEATCLLILSIGERQLETYRKLYAAGARGALLRFETSNAGLYEKFRPGHILQSRIQLIKELRQIGYLIMTGFLIGLPGQSQEDILSDIKLTSQLGTDLFSFGPFIPHPDTPLAKASLPCLEEVLNTIANCRILNPEAKILVTTALDTLDKENGLKFGLLAGGNSLMINITPERYQRLYEIYPDRAGTGQQVRKKIEETVNLLHSLGRAPIDLGF